MKRKAFQVSPSLLKSFKEENASVSRHKPLSTKVVRLIKICAIFSQLVQLSHRWSRVRSAVSGVHSAVGALFTDSVRNIVDICLTSHVYILQKIIYTAYTVNSSSAFHPLLLLRNKQNIWAVWLVKSLSGTSLWNAPWYVCRCRIISLNHTCKCQDCTLIVL